MENSLLTEGSKEVAGVNTASNLLDQKPLSEGNASSNLNDTETSTTVVRNPAIAEHILNGYYPVQTVVLSFLDRTDFRNMQLAGLGLGLSKSLQRKTLVPIACNDSRPASRLWARRACVNSTATMDEVQSCAGSILYRCGHPKSADIKDLNQGHQFAKASDAIGEPNNVCLECVQSAADLLFLYERREIAQLRTTICSKHTRENTPLAHHGPCRCQENLATEWRCWACRRRTLSQILSTAFCGWDQWYVCSMKGCEEPVNQMPDGNGGNGELEMCWGCRMIISPSTGDVTW